MEKEIRNCIAELVLEICDNDLIKACNNLRQMSDYLCEKVKYIETMKKPLIKALKRVSYEECARMLGLKFDNIETFDKFEDLLENAEENEFGFENLRGRYWNYTCLDEFESVIAEHTQDQDGWCDLVMLPNNVMQEIPQDYWYELKIED